MGKKSSTEKCAQSCIYQPVWIFREFKKANTLPAANSYYDHDEFIMNISVKKLSLSQHDDDQIGNLFEDETAYLNNLQILLPTESFVAFDTHQIKNARVAFLNPYMDITEEDALEYAYVIKTEHSDLAFSDNKKTMLAERYGGSGISTHGGGVRCGLTGRYQIKGVGANPLIGQDADYWHSHGSISLRESMYETLWGEVLNKVLPYGAIRCPAIILTTGLTWVKADKETDKVQQPRSILVREPALRPAHFERAYKFRPTETAKQFPRDTLRTKAAIAKLPNALPKPEFIGLAQWLQLSNIEKLNLGLKELCLRVARQTACARAKRFMHGAPGSSNVCLDGKWIDYDTTSLISCYANVITGEGQRSFWEEHLKFYYIINEISFYIHKYFPTKDKSLLAQPLELRQFYYKHFEQYLLKEFIKLTGVPEIILNRIIDSDESLKLASLLIKMARSGNDEKTACIPDDATRMGDYDLPKILFISACCDSMPQLSLVLEPAIKNEKILAEYTAAYENLNALIENEINTYYPLSLNAFRVLRRIKTAKNNRSIPILYRHNAVKEFTSLMTKHTNFLELKQAYRKLFLKTMEQVEVIYGAATEVGELMWMRGAQRIHFDPYKMQWRYQDGDIISKTFDFCCVFDENNMPPELYRMREWWGVEIISELNVV